MEGNYTLPNTSTLLEQLDTIDNAACGWTRFMSKVSTLLANLLYFYCHNQCTKYCRLYHRKTTFVQLSFDCFKKNSTCMWDRLGPDV